MRVFGVVVVGVRVLMSVLGVDVVDVTNSFGDRSEDSSNK